jgi:Flp pilus assembly protein TadB
MFIGNIVNIVQHSHLYNSILLIIVACIVVLLVAILHQRARKKFGARLASILSQFGFIPVSS